jgi:hypothetical protein
MAAATPWTVDDDARLTELHAADTPVRAMGAAIGRTRSSIDRRLRFLGLGATTRLGTMAATAANVADAKGRRALLELALLEDAARLRAQMFAPAIVFNFGGTDNTYEERAVAQPVIADQLKLMQAVGVAIDRSLKIADHDNDTGLIDAIGMLDQVAAGLKTVWVAAGNVDSNEAAPRSDNS